MNRVLLLLVAVALAVASSAAFVIDETEVAIVTQFGQYRRTIERPGLYFKTPFLQDVRRMSRKILGRDTPPDNYLTLDKKKLVADPITRWRIVDPLKFFKVVRDEDLARRRIDDIVKSEMRSEVSSHNFGDIIGGKREPLMASVADRVRQKAAEYGVFIVDVRIKRADLPREVQESVFMRMREERNRVAKKYRSEGAELAAKIRADTDKEATILLAQAYETAEKLRGDGDSASIKIYAEAFGEDPEFYAFTRSLETYEQSIGPDSELVLSTGSDLFKYLSLDGGKAKR